MSGYTDILQSSPQSIFSVVTGAANQQHAVGSILRFGGRAFRYAAMYDTTVIGPNKLAQMAVPLANHVSETGALTGTPTVGATRITAVLGATAAFASQYKDGYLKIESATTGAGQIFKLKDHAAVASAGTLTADIYDPVVTATSGTTTWSLVSEAWSNVVIHPTTATSAAAGVTLANWPAATSTAPNFGWLQTWGMASCLIDTSNIVAGSRVIYGAVAGTVGLGIETDVKHPIGVAVEALSTDNAYGTIFLTIAP
jgi:hypothetical protein